MATESFTPLPEEEPAVALHHLVAVVFLGGAAGAVARTWIAEHWSAQHGVWPWGTFAVNVAGTLVLGALLAAQRTTPRMRGLVGTGLCGGLTTFSTLCVEATGMPAGRAVAYVAATVAAGLLAASVGRRLVSP